MSPEQRCSREPGGSDSCAAWLVGHWPITKSQRQGQPPCWHTHGRGLGMGYPWECDREETGAWGDFSAGSRAAQGLRRHQLFDGDGKRSLGILYYVSAWAAPCCVTGTRWGSHAESQHTRDRGSGSPSPVAPRARHGSAARAAPGLGMPSAAHSPLTVRRGWRRGWGHPWGAGWGRLPLTHLPRKRPPRPSCRRCRPPGSCRRGGGRRAAGPGGEPGPAPPPGSPP